MVGGLSYQTVVNNNNNNNNNNNTLYLLMFVTKFVCLFFSEADQEIAYRANLLDCPVISSDSDFFIYDLKQGYIPLEHLDWRSGSIEARLFKCEKLSQHLKIPKDLLPLLASLLGNDCISFDVLSPFYKALRGLIPIEDRIWRTATFLSKHRQAWLTPALNLVPEYSRRKRLEQALVISIQSYRHCVRLCHPPLKPWISKIRKGLFPIVCVNALIIGKQFLRVQVEDFSAVSANQCSLELRRFMYGIMRDELEAAENRPHAQRASVIEWDRDGEELQNDRVQPCDHVQGFGQLPSLRTVPDLEIAERRTLCLTLLELNTNREIQSLPDKVKLFAGSLRFWFNHAQPAVKTNHLCALLICFFKLTEDKRLQNSQALNSRRRPQQALPFDLAAQHSFAQWQCVMQEAMDLNLLLQKPLHTPLIRHLYDGLLVQNLVWKLEKGKTIYVSYVNVSGL